MAAGDTALWLHNKLGSTDDLWSGRTICSQLSQERLQSIQECFHTLQPHVKVKLLLAFLHMPRRNTEQWKADLEEILTMAENDSDPWVTMVAEMLRMYPSTGTVNLDLDEVSGTFSDVITDLKKMMKKSLETRMLPLECQFVNRSALNSIAGHSAQPIKHFTLKRKPKSATLKRELLQKSNEVSNNRKNNMPNSVPIKIRSFVKKMDDSTPLKGLPSRTPLPSGYRTPSSGLARLNSSPIGHMPIAPRSGSSKKEGGIKFLDIGEQPIGSKEAKRRKKQADVEAMEQQRKEKEASIAAGTSVATTTTAPYTPDYAAGLMTPATPKLATVVVSTTSIPLSASTPAYVPSATSRIPNVPVTGITLSGNIAPLSSNAQATARQNLQQQLQQQLGQSQIRTQTVVMAPPSTTNLQQPIIVQPPAPPAPAAPPMVAQPQVAQGTQIKKALSLTREQMIEAQEMFRDSNKVSRPEKALILGFMAGSRENPCPQQGSVLSIKLSEDDELVQQTDGNKKIMIADTYFQMNYLTGEWKRFKKYREKTTPVVS
ncbi:negative elongation factor A [Patella vulgata]|uniref:negative elongation factor A n=1 Tax=Patella vulgata TaxID=6465 RepID=UPI00217FCD92|nr:negative elongation factor A [Patella vulgata]